MEQAQVNDITLEFEDRGSGEPVLLVHGCILADAFAPLLSEPALADSYRLITYHRVGFGGSTHPDASVSIAEQAAHARALLHYLGVAQAHIVGHSLGGAIALQLALDSPEVVHSLALLEPSLTMVPSADQFFEELEPVLPLYEAGDKQGAIDGFLRVVAGPTYRTAMERVLPAGSFARAVVDADTFFQTEVPALLDWDLRQADAARIKRPVLTVLGADSAPLFREGHELLQDWLAQAEPFVLPNAMHALHLMNPRGMAEGLARFFAHHPVPAAACTSVR